MSQDIIGICTAFPFEHVSPISPPSPGTHPLTRSSVVSRAFQILSDADKKSRYDQFGGDPDSRFSASTGANGSASPFTHFARASPFSSSRMYDDEISPEELFNQF